MNTVAIYFFIFMLISSLLGYLVSWAWSQSRVNALSVELDESKKNLENIQSRFKSLQDHAQQLEKEKEKLVYENERLSLKLSMLLGKSEVLEDQTYIDTSNLDKKIGDLHAQITKLNDEIDVAKRESLEWQVQYSEVMKEKEELAVQLHSLRNPRT